jgi:predicted ABC-type ATPase
MDNLARPNIIILAGPNGAGKTTASQSLLVGALAVQEFVNADTIAKGLSAFRPESVAIEAGRIMLQRLHHLTDQRADVAFETTLASRTFASWIKALVADGYAFRLIFLWLPSADMAVNRVRDRVLVGGHHVPEDVIRRRYQVGLKNFFRLYSPLAESWMFLDNSVRGHPSLVAEGAFDHLRSSHNGFRSRSVGEFEARVDMSPNGKNIDEAFRNPEPILAALRQAYREAVRQHRASGVPMVFWENGKVVEIPADQLEDEPPDTSN